MPSNLGKPVGLPCLPIPVPLAITYPRHIPGLIVLLPVQADPKTSPGHPHQSNCRCRHS